MKTNEGKRVQLTVTDEQLRCIMNALEEHFRLRMGQTYIDLLDDLCFQNVDLGDPGPEHRRKFDDCIARREMAREKLQELMDICFEGDWHRYQKTEEVNNEIDMWSIIRHWFWQQSEPNKRGTGVDSYTPMQFGSEPLIDIKQEE